MIRTGPTSTQSGRGGVRAFELGETTLIPPSIVANALPTAESNIFPSSPEDRGGVRLRFPPLLVHVLPNRANSTESIIIGGIDVRVAIIDCLLYENNPL